MDIRLEEVTRENLRSVCLLSVSPKQEDFVAPNGYSLAQTKFYPFYCPRAIYRDETAVGFLMYCPLEEDGKPNEYCIFRLMVDQRWQQEGIGRRALQMAIDEIRALSPERVTICYEKENTVAKKLYAELGFVEVGVDEDGEIIAELRDGEATNA